MYKKIALIVIPLVFSTAHAMQPHQNQNLAQAAYQQFLQQTNQQFIADTNQRTVQNCIQSGQPIPSQLISTMHPAQAVGAHVYNTNLTCQKK